MNVTCPECSSVFRVDPMKVPEGGVRARCSICGGIISLTRDDPTRLPEPVGVAAQARAPEGQATAPAPAPRDADADRGTGAEAPAAEPPFVRDAAPVDAAPAAAPTFTAQPTPPGRRPINPFLNNDPGMKAKRLARALVSDMITYQPQKREEGLRNNTLKQLFREEIKKSYEEYVEQVGRDVAESTAHFQDALNDILANGRKVF